MTLILYYKMNWEIAHPVILGINRLPVNIYQYLEALSVPSLPWKGTAYQTSQSLGSINRDGWIEKTTIS